MSPKKPKAKKAAKKVTAIVKAGKLDFPVLTKTQALELEKGIVGDFQSAEKSVVAASLKYEKFVNGKGWVALGFPGQTEWREARIPFAEFYNARAAMKLLKAGVPPEQVEKMKLTNINTMTRSLPQSSWLDPKIQTLAEGPIAEFAAVAGKESESIGMHVEREDVRGFKGSASLIKNWDLCISIAKLVDGCNTQEKQIEALVACYLNGNSGTPGMSRIQLYQENYGEQEKKAS